MAISTGKELLKDLFLRQVAVRGGHNKARIVKDIAPDANVVYIGDGIVDADPLEFSLYSISLNCTDEFALQAAKINIVTENLSSLLPLLSDLQHGRVSVENIKGRYPDMRVFDRGDVQNDFQFVGFANAEVRKALKDRYSPPDSV
jgi:predicted HAD superfamily phosphohydrolase